MERKELVNLAVELIEEALEEPNKLIILEERVTSPICEPGVREPTEEELESARDKVMECITRLSRTSLYYFDTQDTSYTSNHHDHRWKYALYKNGSKIIIKHQSQTFFGNETYI